MYKFMEKIILKVGFFKLLVSKQESYLFRGSGKDSAESVAFEIGLKDSQVSFFVQRRRGTLE